MTELPDGRLFVAGEWETGGGAEITSIFPADGSVKTAILGGNNARLYRVTAKMQAAVLSDRVAQVKATYERMGPDPSNLRYGYIAKPAA